MQRHGSTLVTFAKALLLLVILLLLWRTRAFVLLLFVGITFGVTLGHAGDVLERSWRLPRSISSPLIVLLCVALLALGTWKAAPSVSVQMRELEQHVPAAIDRIEDALRNRTVAGVELAPADIKPRRVARQFLSGHSREFASLLFPFVSNMLASVVGVLVVLFLAIYFAAEPRVYRRGVLRLFPIDRRERAGRILSRAASILRQWLAARLLAMLIIGGITGLVLRLFGIPAYAALGALAGLLEFIPFFGPIVSAVPAVAMALTVAPAKALYVALAYLVIQQLEGNLITPLLMRNRIAVPPVLTIAAVSMMGIVFDVLGMLVSEPVAALAILVTRELHVRPLENGSHGPEDDEPDEHQRDHAQEEPGQPAGELGAKALRNHR